MNLSKFLGMAILAMGIGVGTQSCKSVKSVALDSLSGAWELKTLNGTEAKSAFEGKTPSVQFDIAASRIYGNGGCNNYNGGFKYEKGEFSAPNLASTMMMCVHQNKESEFLQTLSRPSQLSLSKEGELVFLQGGKDVLVFAKPATVSEADLAGQWTLETIEGAAAASIFNAEKLPTIEFKDGRVSGHAGCNRYNGPATLDANKVKFGALVSTRMACNFLEGEGKFLKILDGELNIVVDGNKLSFSKNGVVVLVFGK